MNACVIKKLGCNMGFVVNLRTGIDQLIPRCELYQERFLCLVPQLFLDSCFTD